MFHAYGLGNSLIFPLAAGATAILVPTRPPKPVVVSATLVDEQPTLFFSVPTSYAALAESLPHDAFKSVRQAVSAGEALPAEIFEHYRDHFGLEDPGRNRVDGDGPHLHLESTRRGGRWLVRIRGARTSHQVARR